MNNDYRMLEFASIIEKLKEHALSEKAKTILGQLSPYLSEEVCIRKMAETTSARKLLDGLGAPPLPLMTDLAEMVALAEAGSMLLPEQLGSIAMFAESCKRMTSYLSRGETINAAVASYGRSIESLADLRQEIETCVNGNKIRDDASAALKNLRRKIEHVEYSIKEKLAHILQSRKHLLADGYITNRQGRYVLPVQRKFQTQFGGTVVEISAKGGTVFMEPAGTAKLQGELDHLLLEEDTEVRCILYTLTSLVVESAASIRRNMEAMEILDVLFAKAKLSAAMKAVPVEIGGARRLDIRQGRHPLLAAESCVPLNLRMEEDTIGVIITGPNTGGKTVAVKTVGLLSIMAQCGLHLPCAEGSYFAMQDHYWCDIGDSQNISQNLSTFSGHMTNVIRILEGVSRDGLVLLDELGSGTDPAEGMGIAIAVLEELKQRGCMFLVTTHYPQVKTYAEETAGVQSARMAFDRESLRPLYQLEMGKAGESCALHIASRLGLAPHLLQRAHCVVYGEQEVKMKPEAAVMKAPKSRLQRAVEKKETVDLSAKFAMGDSVAIMPGEEIAIVYRPADQHGDVVVQVKGEKRKVRHNRLKLRVAAAELYPADYDFSIIFDSVENRKARHQLDRKYVRNVSIVYEDEINS